MSITRKVPEITSAAITPNPADINNTVKLIVKVVEKIVILTEEKIYSNEVYSGEV